MRRSSKKRAPSSAPARSSPFSPDDIHSVINESDEFALSLNLYGLSYGYTGASRFDPMAHTEGPLIPKT
ncbi:MAG TPA: hypothetical protein VGL83_19390 [Stellaceae bacterium]|jgi:hypothetical protein